MVPALAVADELRAQGAEVVFVGGDRAEATLVPEAGYELQALRLMALPRSANLLAAARAVAVEVSATSAAKRLLKRLAPQAVLGAGGYVAGPVALAAVTRRVPLVLSEADSHLGLTNRLLAPFAARACLAFPLENRRQDRYVVTGRRCRPRHRSPGCAPALRNRPRRHLRARVWGIAGRALDQPCRD